MGIRTVVPHDYNVKKGLEAQHRKGAKGSSMKKKKSKTGSSPKKEQGGWGGG